MQPRLVGNFVCFTHPQPDKIASVIPGTKVNGYLLGVPLTLDNAQVLRNLGVPAPSPVRVNYQWKGRFTPLPHQVVTAENATLYKRLFILNDMGTMKTISSLWAADYLMEQGVIQRVLIVSPLSTLERVWGDEIFKNFPRRKFSVLYGSSAKRKELLRHKADFYIVNHHGVEIIKEELRERKDITLFILDELATFRNSQTKMWKTMKSLITPERWVWGLTGSPTPNEPTDCYGQMKLIKPENFLGSFTKFRDLVMMKFGPYKWVPRKGWEQEVNRVLQPCVRYALEDCVDLPPTIYLERQAELSAEQREHFVKLQRECVTEIRGNTVSAVNAGVLLSKLTQAACGVVYASDGSTLKIDFGPRLQVLQEIVEECREKIIIFVPLTGTLNALADELRKRYVGAHAAAAAQGKDFISVVDGSTSSGRRNQIFQGFQHETYPHILLANSQTMAHGLTLTAATTICWYAPIHSNEFYEQANARIARPGQTKTTRIVHIHATAVERRIYETLKAKGAMQQVVLDMAREGTV